MEQEEGETSQEMGVKPVHSSPIYASDSTSAFSGSMQPRNQSIDIRNIAVSIASKALIILMYFVLEGAPLFDFIFVLSLISVDFWMCKNIYGKNLAGLRWWIEQDPVTGQEEWIFESADPNITIHPINYGCFWVPNCLVCLFWVVNFLIVLIASGSLFWVGLCLFCFFLTLINLVCFYKCRGAHQKKLTEIMEKVGLSSAANILKPAAQQSKAQKNQHQPTFDIQ